MSAKNSILFLLLVIIACTSCHSNNKSNKALPGELNDEWYKRYTGTIAGKNVVVNLHHYDGETIGSYYYAKKSVLIDLTESKDEPAGAYNLSLDEFVRTDRTRDDDNYKANRWAVNIGNNTIKGKWIGSDSTKFYDIDLKEDYTENSYQFNILLHQDSIQEKIGVVRTVAVSSYQLLMPDGQMKKEDAGFFQSSILHIIGADSLGAKDFNQYISKEDKKYFTDYRKLIADVKIDKDNDESWQYNFYRARNVWVLYNANGLLSLQVHQYEYSGGGSGRGNYLSSYACIDVQQKKTWQLRDVIKPGNDNVLTSLIEHEVRRIFKLGANDTLSNTLITDTIPLTQNMIITETGLTFCYNEMEIGTEPDGEICVFIPYSKVADLLTEEFKKRMGL